MTKKEEKYINTWKRNIEKGKTVYIIKFTMFWTLGMSFFTPLLMMLFDFDFSMEYISSYFSFPKILIMLFIQAIVSVGMSFAIWNSSTKKYNKLINKD